ncbi:DNA-directed RNA polymerase specialized sigma subunit [Paenarthrobacter histidinolovorans]|uniref:DNA-directed RNA polymerase specialized sigma subunit n=2 Tax=Paenarthrobacter histidinolovorans TaxID=43664 RepID=A0ABW8MZQ4_9MICC
MPQKREFEAIAHKEGKWWEIHIHELDRVTQASRTKDIQAMATDLAAVVLDVDPDEVTVHVTLRPPGDVMERWSQARADLERAQELSAKGAAESRAIVAELSKDFTITEVARMLGISTQRVSQLKAKKANEA